MGANTLKVDAAATNNYNPASTTVSVLVQYATVGSCLGSAGHSILQPINMDGTSTFKQGSTVPAKFRVCDAYGNSVGAAGVVKSFLLVNVLNGTTSNNVNEAVDSTTPDQYFRWDPTAQQWIFNISTKPLLVRNTYNFQYALPK